MKSYFAKLYKNRQELMILELTYAILTALSIVVAGLVALLNQSLGVGLLIIPLVSFVGFLMNIVTWAMVKLIFDTAYREKNGPSVDSEEVLAEPKTVENAKLEKKVKKSTKKASVKK